MKIGFDNDKYLKMQSEHIRERIGKFDNKLISSSAASSLTTTMHPACFPVSRRTASSGCSKNSATRRRS